MDIPAMSMAMTQACTRTMVSTQVLSMSLDSLEDLGDSMIKMMEQSVTPNLGTQIDISV